MYMVGAFNMGHVTPFLMGIEVKTSFRTLVRCQRRCDLTVKQKKRLGVSYSVIALLRRY